MLGILENNKITQYPIDVIDLRKKYPNTSFPDDISSSDLSSFNVVTIEKVSRPSFNEKNQTITENDPVLDSGKWKQSWTVSDLSSDAVTTKTNEKWESIRTVRNELLSESDWRASSDLTLSDAWKNYRQSLRDITTQSDPYNITWPTEPS
tara:strand:+ start:924 stop:1373 length:450 start_codon:yes stop_codon:yes gene_type:complete